MGQSTWWKKCRAAPRQRPVSACAACAASLCSQGPPEWRECCEAPACLPACRGGVYNMHINAPRCSLLVHSCPPPSARYEASGLFPLSHSEPHSVASLDWWPIFPLRSCSPVVVVVVAHVLEQRLTRLGPVLVRVCLRVRCLSYLLSVCEALTVTLVVQFSMRGAALSALGFGVSCTADPQQHSSRLGGTASLIC